MNDRTIILSARFQTGYTLPELLIAMGIFSLVAAGVLQVHLMGLRMDQLARSKLGASEDSRAAIGRMVREIRTAGSVKVGTGDQTTFDEVAHGQTQQGNALEIQAAKNDPTAFIRYYRDAEDGQLKRVTDDEPNPQVIANAIRNAVIFTAEDSSGNVLTNNQNNRIVGVQLEFQQLQHPTVEIGPGSLYDFYQLRTKVTRRALE